MWGEKWCLMKDRGGKKGEGEGDVMKRHTIKIKVRSRGEHNSREEEQSSRSVREKGGGIWMIEVGSELKTEETGVCCSVIKETAALHTVSPLKLRVFMGA